MKLRRRFNDETKKINKNKEFDLNKEMNSVLERKRLIDDIYRFRNKDWLYESKLCDSVKTIISERRFIIVEICI